jgi:hypothetical protein
VGSNSKFKTILGRFSHWITIEGDQLARRLDVSAHRIFEFGTAGMWVEILTLFIDL